MEGTGEFDIVLSGGAPWGFRLQGGREFRSPLQVVRVTSGGKAQKGGLKERDFVLAINGSSCDGCLHNDALQRVKSATTTLTLSVSRGSPVRLSSSSSASSVTSATSPTLAAVPISAGSAKSATAPTSAGSAKSANAPTSAGSARSATAPTLAAPATPATPATSAQQWSSPAPTAVPDGSTPPAAPPSGISVPAEGGQKADKGWYKQMFKTIHATPSEPDNAGPASTPSSASYNRYDARKSLPTGSVSSSSTPTKPVSKWTPSSAAARGRPASTSVMDTTSSAKLSGERRFSASGANVAGSSGGYTRRGSRDPAPSVSARAEFFRQKEKQTAAKDSGLSPTGQRTGRGNVVSPALTWSQRQAAAQQQQQQQAAAAKTATLPSPARTTQPSAPKPAIETKSASLPRGRTPPTAIAGGTSDPGATSVIKERSTPSPFRSTPEPKPAEGYNSLNTALSDLNNAISNLEEATTTAAEKESRKKAPWQPGGESKQSSARPAPVLSTHSTDHQSKISGVLAHKLDGGRRDMVQKVVVQPARKSEPIVLPPPIEEEEAPPSPTPAPSEPEPVVKPVTQQKPPSTHVSIEPEVTMQLQPPVEAFVINLPPLEAEPEPCADAALEADYPQVSTSAKEIDDLLDAHMKSKMAETNSSPAPADVSAPEPRRVDPIPPAKPAPQPAVQPGISRAMANQVLREGHSKPSPPTTTTTEQSKPRQVMPTDEMNTGASSQSAAGKQEVDGPALPDLEPGQGYGTALYAFTPQGKRELPLKRGDQVLLARRVDANWMEGIVAGKKGIFPATYIKVHVAPTAVAGKPARTPVPNPPSNTQPATALSVASASATTASVASDVVAAAAAQTVPSDPVSAATAGGGSTTGVSGVQVRERKADEDNYGRARARFSFQAESTRELSLTKGGEVTLVRRVDSNWYEGMVGPGLKGIVPASYLEVIDDVPIMKRKSAAAGFQGDMKTPPGRPAEGPRKSSANQTQDTFAATSPVNSIGATSPAPPAVDKVPATASNSVGERFQALYNYAPQNEDELELVENDIIWVVEQCTDGWFVGTSERTQHFGTFPGNYVTPA